MYIDKVLSYHSAWEVLNDTPKAYSDLSKVISNLTLENLTDGNIINNPSGRSRILGTPTKVTSKSIPIVWDTFMRELNWESFDFISPNENGYSFRFPYFKHNINVHIMTEEMIRFPNWLLIETPTIFNHDSCKLCILVCPMESVIESYPKTEYHRKHYYTSFEKCLVQFKEFLPLNHEKPILIIGISNSEAPTEIHKFSSSENKIERVLEFPTEYYQAGVGILSYFGDVLKQKHPTLKAKVRIEQDENTIRMIIDTPDGSRDIIEKTLDNYSLVIANKDKPESLLDDQLQIASLKNRLAIADLEVRQARDLMLVSDNLINRKINTLEEEVKYLRTHISNQMQHMSTSQSLILHQSEKEERVLLQQINISQRAIQQLIKNSSNNFELQRALIKLNNVIENGEKDSDESSTKEALTTIKETSPDTFESLSEALKNTAYGVSGNIAFQWLQQVACLVS